MPADSSNWRMANRLADGKLDDELRRLRDQGLSLAKISTQLFTLYGIEVAAPTVSDWIDQLPADEPAEAAS